MQQNESLQQKDKVVTILSTGLTCVTRELTVPKGRHSVQVRARNEDVSHVLSSLFVRHSGGLKWSNSTFESLGGKPRFTIDPANIMLSLCQSLQGQEVELNIAASQAKVKGKLVGLTKVAERSQNEKVFVGVLNANKALVSTDINTIIAVTAQSKEVQAEIERALAASAGNVGITDVVLDLDAAEESAAELRFNFPGPIWTLSYIVQQKAQGFSLKGFADVHNPGAESWEQVQLELVTGNPNDFRTTIAQPRVMPLSTVEIGPRGVVGPVATEEPEMLTAKAASGRPLMRRGPTLAFACALGAGGHEAVADAAMLETAMEPQAVATKGAGDYCKFRSLTPVTIPAGKSAHIPVLDLDLPDAKRVLVYDPQTCGKNPFQAVVIKNEWTNAIGAGVASIELMDSDGLAFAGRVEMPSIQPGEKATLSHGQESRVKVDMQQKESRHVFRRLSIGKGVLLSEGSVIHATTYTIRNLADQEFALLIQHQRSERDSKFYCSGASSIEPLRTGARVSVQLKPSSVTTVTIREVSAQQRRIEIQEDPSFNINPVVLLIEQAGDLKNDPKVAELLQCGSEQEAAQKAASRLNQEIRTLDSNVKRLQESLKAIGNDPGRQTWVANLTRAEEALTGKQTELAQNQEKIEQLTQKRHKLLLSLEVSWQKRGRSGKKAAA